MCAEEPFMPITESKWIENYKTEESIQENVDKGNIYFNYIIVIRFYATSLFGSTFHEILYKAFLEFVRTSWNLFFTLE